jgi:hypothetical protein
MSPTKITMLVIQVLAWDRHTNVAGLSQPYIICFFLYLCPFKLNFLTLLQKSAKLNLHNILVFSGIRVSQSALFFVDHYLSFSFVIVLSVLYVISMQVTLLSTRY